MKAGEIKQRTYEIIEKGRKNDTASLCFDYFIIILIFLNVVAIILESFEDLYANASYFFRIFEIVSVVIFTVEYLLRIWTADNKYPGRPYVVAILRFAVSPLALTDLFAILPFYLPMILPIDLRFLRILRLIRLLRVAKTARFTNAYHMIGKVIKDKKEELLTTVFITFLLLILSSVIMYHIEHAVQPDKFPNILSSFWWAVATLTTIGYGDVYPITGAGRLLSGFIALLGIGLVALPTGILSSGFMEEIGKKREQHEKQENGDITYCPYCGKRIKR